MHKDGVTIYDPVSNNRFTRIAESNVVQMTATAAVKCDSASNFGICNTSPCTFGANFNLAKILALTELNRVTKDIFMWLTTNPFTNFQFSNANIIITMLICLLSGTAQIANSADFEEMLNLDFESGTVGGRESGNSPVTSKDVARTGNSSMKSYLNRLTSSTSYRTEIVVPQPEVYAFNEDYWIGFSVYLPSSYVVSDVYEILAQWHARPDKSIGEDYRNPPIGLATTGGNWLIGAKWDSKENTWADGTRKYDGSEQWNLGPVTADIGRWVDWVFHIKFSWSSDGILQVWKDGKLVVERFGPNTFNDQRGPYMKMGMYTGWKDRNCCEDKPAGKTVYHDALRIVRGADAKYENVAPDSPSPAIVLSPPSPPLIRIDN